MRSSGALCPQRASRVFWLHSRISALCGEARVVSSLMAAGVPSGRGASREGGMEKGVRGEVVVGALETMALMRVGTVAGVTFSMRRKAGRRRTVVGSE